MELVRKSPRVCCLLQCKYFKLVLIEVHIIESKSRLVRLRFKDNSDHSLGGCRGAGAEIRNRKRETYCERSAAHNGNGPSTLLLSPGTCSLPWLLGQSHAWGWFSDCKLSDHLRIPFTSHLLHVPGGAYITGGYAQCEGCDF